MGSGCHEKPGALRKDISCWIAAVRTHYLVLMLFTLVVYFPRLCLSYVVFFIAQLMRLVARILGVQTARPVQNRRILVITDYLPPQTHGIAIRCHAYVKHLRAQGHEVVVFCTAYEPNKETSFDHPNIPCVVNPFNTKNRIGYNPGVKLAWFLGAHTWDVVHIFYPSLVGSFVLSTCAWRQIPVYCSHHVEMSMFAYEHVNVAPIATFALVVYYLVGKWPAVQWGTLNAAPTLCFARDHLGTQREERLRRVPSGTHEVFRSTPDSSDERRQVRMKRFGVEEEETKVVLFVQRLSPEKGTERIFPALKPKEGGKGSGSVDAVLVVAGDGPSRPALEAEAKRRKIRAVFLGNVPHHELPSLYRAADCWVTMSLSETFGLTTLEALMCGCPAIIPYCDVFNEIWDERVPKSWRYHVGDVQELESAIRAAQDGGREWLGRHPVQMTWKDASDELLLHYEECIKMKAKDRQTLHDFVQLLDRCVRLALCTAFATWVLARYYYRPLRVFLQRFGITI